MRSIDQLQNIGFFVAVLLAAIAAIVSALAKRWFSVKVGGLEVAFDRDFKPTANLEKDSRLIEARELLRRQESNATWNSRAAASLVFGQYVVGGVLATSFIQESLSSKAVGLLGVLVLISSLIHQNYRPDVQSRGARERALRLRKLIRHAEDALYSIQAGVKEPSTIHNVRQTVSIGITEIETMELGEASEDREKSA